VFRFSLYLLVVLVSTATTAQAPVPSCVPPADESLVISLDNRDENGNWIPIRQLMPRLADYLNSGGTDMSAALEDATASTEFPWRNLIFIRDVTGDSEPEIVVQLAVAGGNTVDSFFEGAIFAFRCERDRYQGYQVAPLGGYLGGDFTGDESGLRAIQDINGNGIPEFLTVSISNIGIHADYTRDFIIYEWNGSEFMRLIPDSGNESLSTSDATTFLGDGEIRDADGNGTLELVLTSAAFRHHSEFEWSRLDRADEFIWAWNGTEYEMVCFHAAAPPQYRIQAIQDGSDAIACGRFDEALAFYRRTIEDDTLLPWTEADNACPGCEPDSANLENWQEHYRLLGTPIPDPDERARLSAYAHYRIMLVLAAQNQPDLVQAEHALLLEFASTNGIGTQYAELATVFWETYRVVLDLIAACRAVKEIAAEDGIVSPISTYNFYSTEPYPTEDICPF
jgi:hypothetical protein